MDDPYWKIRPVPPTPEEETCTCSPLREIILRYELSPNPLFCVAGNLEVRPELLDLEPGMVDDIAEWVLVYGALYHLWLDSGEYEDWASARLLDPKGSVNVEGRRIVGELNRIVPTYYWWFQDTGSDDFQPTEQCPVCAELIPEYPDRELRVCARCRILV